MDSEGLDKSLQLLDLNIVNTGDDDYTISIHRKNAITNVQVKPNSGHDPKILRGIFTGFLHRAYTNCKSTQHEEEINFLIQCFTENVYNERQLRKIAEDYQQKMTTPTLEDPTPNTNDIAIVTLP